ncbi:MAG: ribbon-helix-helix domain-containing protein [Patescibacteria group bacterium]
MAKVQKRTQHKQTMGRINLSIPEGLLELVDKEAERAFTTRSDIMRTALLWYLKPQGRELNQTDPEIILKTLQQQHTKVAVRKMLLDQDVS